LEVGKNIVRSSPDYVERKRQQKKKEEDWKKRRERDMEGMRKVGKQEVGQNGGGEMRNSRKIGEELGKR